MYENVNVCITPKGDKPILHFSQFDNKNIFTVTVLSDDGESAAVLTGLDIEFRLRKTDSHVVTIAPESVADNVITFKTTEQLCACCGQNIASVVLMKDDMVISTLDILVDIQRDILSGGLTSESDIRNLTTQIEQIVPEVVGENYYDKQEVDELIAEHTFDPSDYYDKQEVDEKIAEIPTFDPSNYYDKSDVDDLMSDKADSADVYTKAETDNLLADKADKSAIASLIVQKDVAKAPIASFNTDLAEALTKIIVDINPVQSGTGTPSPSNVRPISGHTALNVTLADRDMQTVDTKTVNFGQTVYGGSLDVTNGKVTITHGIVDLGTLSWTPYNNTFYAQINNAKSPSSASTVADIICSQYEADTLRNVLDKTTDGIIAINDLQSRVHIYDSAKSSMTGADFKTAMSGVQLVYELATPIEITTTPENLTAIRGENNVFSDTNGDTEVRFAETIGNELGV